MRVPITSNDSARTAQQGPNSLVEEAMPHEELPAYSREPTEDGFALEHQAELEMKKGSQIEVTEQPVLPTNQEPGYAAESMLRRGLQVPTKSRLITSGFVYPEILARCDIDEDQWSNFCGQITSEAELTSSQWNTTIGTGIGTFVVGGIFFGWLGVIPAAVVGHHVRARNEAKNLSYARSSHKLQTILDRWNDVVFRPKGLVIRVDLPGEIAGIDEMDVEPGKCRMGKPCQRTPRSDRAEARLARWAQQARKRAVKKGRIVILPVGEEASRLAATMPTRGISPSPSPVDGTNAPPYESSPTGTSNTYTEPSSYPNEKTQTP